VKEERARVAKPPGIDHYYIMEMMEQPESVRKALNYGARLMGAQESDHRDMVKLGGLEENEEKLSAIENLVIAACGTSFYAG
jgi:glutamine---fructose-6-phosphate transaminase (isomerizing)